MGGTTCGTRNITLGPTLVANEKSGINSCTKKGGEGEIRVEVSTKGGEGWDKNIINMRQIDPEVEGEGGGGSTH
jgi:hypothetical protein